MTIENTLPVEEVQNDIMNFNLDVNMDNIMDYIVNPTSENENVKKVVENQNHSMSNSVEKVIINPDTLSKKDHGLLKNIVLPEDLVAQINNELHQSFIIDNLENSIVNNIEESSERGRNVHSSLDSLYPKHGLLTSEDVEDLKVIQHQNDEAIQTSFRKKSNSTSNSLFKKVMSGLFLDRNEKSKSTSSSDIMPTKNKAQPTNGLSTLYTISSPTINNVNSMSGLKSPLSPTLSSPTINNAVIISSSTNNKQSNQTVPSVSSSSSSFSFLSLPFKSKSVSHEIANNIDDKHEIESINSVSSIQNLKEIKSMIDHQSSNSKKEEKVGREIKSNKSGDVQRSKSIKGRGSSNTKIDFNSFLNVFNNLSDAYAQSAGSQNSLDEVHSSNSNEDLPKLGNSAVPSRNPSYSSLKNLSSVNNGSSFMTSLPLLSNGNSYVVLPPLHNSTFSSNNSSEDNNNNSKDKEIVQIIKDGQKISTSSSLLKDELNESKTEQEPELEPKSIKHSLSYTKTPSYLNHIPKITSYLSKGIQYTDSPETSSISIISGSKKEEENSYGSSYESSSLSLISPIEEEVEVNVEEISSPIINTLPPSSNDQNKKINKNITNNNNTSTKKTINDTKKNNNNGIDNIRRSRSVQRYGPTSRHYSISAPRAAFSNFLSNFSFTSYNSNSDESDESESENELADHSFIKSTASLLPSFITAEAEKKKDTSKTSVFDPDFIEKVREKTISHRKSMFLTTSKGNDKYAVEPSSFNSIIPEPEKLRLVNPVYARAQYLEKLQDHDSHPVTLSEMDQEVASPDQILDTITAEKLRFHLPRRYRDYSSWELIYSLSDHGSSFLTLYDRIVGKGPLLLAIKDTQNQIFGAYIPSSVKVSTRFYGTGECFLWSQGDEKSHRPFKVYEWAGLNEFNVLTSRETIAFGGGKQGRFGLSIDPDLEGGTTAFCDTFKNEPLTVSCREDDVQPQTLPTYYYETPNIPFECVNIEFWKIVDEDSM